MSFIRYAAYRSGYSALTNTAKRTDMTNFWLVFGVLAILMSLIDMNWIVFSIGLVIVVYKSVKAAFKRIDMKEVSKIASELDHLHLAGKTDSEYANRLMDRAEHLINKLGRR